MKRARYTEPVDFIPKEVRKELKLGEFAEDEEQQSEKAAEEDNKRFREWVSGKKPGK